MKKTRWQQLDDEIAAADAAVARAEAACEVAVKRHEEATVALQKAVDDVYAHAARLPPAEAKEFMDSIPLDIRAEMARFSN